MLVASDAVTVAVRGSDGLLYFPARPADRFAARSWLRQDGDARDMRDAMGIGACDGLVCVMQTPAGQVVLSREPQGPAQDCTRAAILVSAATADCKGPHFVADGPRGARDQGYAIWFTPKLKIESVRQWRGDRPWVAQ